MSDTSAAEHITAKTAPRKNKPRCKSCRWWERSCNFKAKDRDWGTCHFWSRAFAFNANGVFIDGIAGHEPRGANTCGFHNATPELRDKVSAHGGADRKRPKPSPMTEGEYD